MGKVGVKGKMSESEAGQYRVCPRNATAVRLEVPGPLSPHMGEDPMGRPALRIYPDNNRRAAQKE